MTFWDFCDRNVWLLVVAGVMTSPIWGVCVIAIAEAVGTAIGGRRG